MTRDVSCCISTDSLSVAAQLMWDGDCGAVPVLHPDSGEVVAMITDRDICMATLMSDRPPSAIPVSSAMSRTLYRCSPEDTLAQAESILRSRQIRRLPVTDDDGQLVGILSLADMVRAAARDRVRSRKDVVPEEVTGTLEVICRPRVRHAFGA
jgi:CBS domain-containing protein